MADCRCGVSVDIPVLPGVTVPLPVVPGVCAPVPCGPPGVDGYSPTVKVERNTEGALITITDKTGTTQAQIYDGDVSREEWLYAFPTDTASGAVASFPDGADGLPLKSLTVAIRPAQSGSGDPAPDNVRPITGFTTVNLWRTGKNLLYVVPESASKNAVTFANDGGIVTAAGTASGTNNFSLGTVKLKAGQSYTLSGCAAGGGQGKYGLALYDGSGTMLVTDFGSGITYTPTTDGEYSVRIRYWYNQVISGVFRPQVEPESVASAWAPYSGIAISISIPTPPGTVYAGTLDVLAGTLTIDAAMVDLGDLSWSRFDTVVAGEYRFGSTGINSVVKKPLSLSEISPLVCSQYVAVRGSDPNNNVEGIAIHTNGNILVYDNALSHATAEDFKSAMSGVQLVYPLATTQTYQLTPQEVTTLLGANNIWSDAGDVSVDYRADPTLYINGKLAALQALILENGG